MDCGNSSWRQGDEIEVGGGAILKELFVGDIVVVCFVSF